MDELKNLAKEKKKKTFKNNGSKRNVNPPKAIVKGKWKGGGIIGGEGPNAQEKVPLIQDLGEKCQATPKSDVKGCETSTT